MDVTSIDAKHRNLPRFIKGAAEPFVASSTVLIASFANFLAYHNYPAFQPEIGIVTLGFLSCTLLFSLLHSSVSLFGKALLDALLVGLAFDFNSNFTLFSAILAGVVAVLRLSRNISLLKPLTIVAGAILISAGLGLSEKRDGIETSLGKAGPTTRSDSVLHVVLDEHGGAAGTSDSVLRQHISKFYVSNGFQLLDRAYSRHFHTVNAVPDILNFGRPGTSKNINETLDVGKTVYFDLLEKRGYRLNFYQSDFANFCHYQRYASCTTYWSPSLSFLAPTKVSSAEKARLIAYKFANLSGLISTSSDLYSYLRNRTALRKLGLPPFIVKQGGLSASLGGFAIIDRMSTDLRNAQPGNVYFAHVLAPHYPYVVSDDCTVQPPTRWGYRRSNESIDVRRAKYAAQVRCLITRLERVITAFSLSPAGKDAAIIIHGDHGDRITTVEPADWNRDKIPAADFMAGYSTIFAVKANYVPAGVDEQPRAAPEVLRTLANNQFKSLDGLPVGDERVHLDGPKWSVGPITSLKDSWPSAN